MDDIGVTPDFAPAHVVNGDKILLKIKVASWPILVYTPLQMGKSTACLERKTSGPKPEFPGLGKDAAALGVSRYFLWKVLKGFATSKPLLERYNELHRKKTNFYVH
jgi:hypothetical protein